VKKKLINLQTTLILFLPGLMCCDGQKPFGVQHLIVEKVIELPEVRGRIDHMAINLRNNVIYIAALGNNTVEVVDLNKASLVYSIKGLDEPQGICYIPVSNEIVIANGGNGKCMFYNASTYSLLSTIDVGGDADNIRYDDRDNIIYVGYGNGGIAAIDAKAHKKINEVKLPAHPESFQLDHKHHLLFVNLPDDNSIAVVDQQNLKVADIWETKGLRANFPMTLDTTSGIVIVGFRNPATLVIYNPVTGQEQNRTELIGDVDDVFFDEKEQEIFASGGSGYINIFKKENDHSFKKIASIPTRSGARTSLLVPSLRKLIVAERSSGGKTTALVVYKINE